MEMEVVVAVPPPPPLLPLPSMDFNFDSNCSSPYITAPSSPQPFGNLFFSAPTSPTRSVSSFFHDHINNNNNNNNDLHTRHSSASEPNNNNDVNEDFEFDFSGHLERPSLSADELFHGGKIRPLKLPQPTNKTSSTRREKRLIHNEPFRETTRKRVEEGATTTTTTPSSISSGRKGSRRRSLSPSRVSDSDRNRSSVCDSDDVSQKGNNNKGVSSSTFSFLSSISFTKGYHRKWKLKDFLLFRSASEGRATDKDPLRKYMVLSKTTAHEDVRNSSFRSTESSGSVSRRRGPVSAHELHYTLNRAASEELKKKTLLPYKQGLLGCLGFNTGMHHSRRIGSFERS